MRSLIAALAVLAGIWNAPALAQPYPNKPVRIIITTPAGGLADLVGRTIAEELRTMFGQPFVVENKPGASGKIGTELAARAAPDGYTLLFTRPAAASPSRRSKGASHSFGHTFGAEKVLRV